MREQRHNSKRLFYTTEDLDIKLFFFYYNLDQKQAISTLS